MADEHLDDDEFDDYNPHPYAGGYDISAAYGSPLPPSHATCYPVSSPAAVPAPTAPQPRSPLPHQPSPRPPQPPAPAQPLASSPVAEPYYWPKPYDYGDAPPYQPAYATPEVFRGWPFLPGAPCRGSACGRDYWRQCMRGLDYLFGHSDGYGERRIGVDCLGVPVYANRKGGVEDAVVVVEVVPPVTGTVEWHDTSVEQYQSNQLPWYDNTEEETYAQPTYPSYHRSYEQCYGVSDETTSWFPNQSYQEVYKEEESQYQECFFYNEDSKISSQPIFSYHQHFGEEPLHFHVEPPETVSSHKLEYYEEFISYNEDSKISSEPTFSYNQHFSEEPLHFHVEPPETVSSHKLEYYESFSAYNDQNNVDNLERQSYEIQPYTHMPYDQLEPYRPSWSLNPGYYQPCTEGMSMTSEYDNHTLASGGCWDMSSLFMSPFYPQDIQVYEQSHGDENV